MSHPTISPTGNEILAAMHEAGNHILNAVHHGNRHHHTPSTYFEHQIIGVLGEMTFARFVGIPRNPPNWATRKNGDVGSWEVRTRKDDQYPLCVDATWPDLRSVALVLVVPDEHAGWKLPAFLMRGWITVGEARKPEWRHHRDYRISAPPRGDDEAGYFVPIEALRPWVEPKP